MATVEGSISHSSSGGHHPIFSMGLGAVMIVIFIWGLMLQIQTSEAMLLGAGTIIPSFSNWSVLTQIPDMFMNGSTFQNAMATFLAWSIECAYFAALIFHERSMHIVSSSGQLMVKAFRVGIFLCVLYNMISDYNCGTLGSGTFGHLSFSLLMTFVEAFFGIIGVALVAKGWRSA